VHKLPFYGGATGVNQSIILYPISNGLRKNRPSYRHKKACFRRKSSNKKIRPEKFPEAIRNFFKLTSQFSDPNKSGELCKSNFLLTFVLFSQSSVKVVVHGHLKTDTLW